MIDSESISQSIRRYAAVLRRQWWVVTLVAVMAIGGAVAYIERAKPVYSASMKLVVGQGETLFAPGLSVNVQPYTQTITDLLQSQVVARKTISSLGLNISPVNLINELGVSAGPTTSVVNVTYNDTSRARAVAVLSTLGTTFTNLVNNALTKRPSSGSAAAQAASQPVSVVVFDPAHIDPGQVSPKVARTLVIATVLGLLAGVLLAFLRDAVSSRIRNEDEAEAAYGVHAVGALPRGTLRLPPGQVAALPSRRSARVTEAVKMLTARVCYTSGLEQGVIVVVGAQPEDGKTTVAAHLASSLADSGSDVIAVEADLHRPALHLLLGVEAGHEGLRDVVVAEQALASTLITVSGHSATRAPRARRRPAAVAALVSESGGVEGSDATPEPSPRQFQAGKLRLLPAGLGTENPLNVLSLTNASSIVARLRSMSDYVVIDTPPLLLSGDAYPLVQLADAVIVVCREQATRRDEAQRVRTVLKSLGVHKFSLVISESVLAGRENYYSYAATDSA